MRPIPIFCEEKVAKRINVGIVLLVAFVEQGFMEGNELVAAHTVLSSRILSVDNFNYDSLNYINL